jgi:transposase
MDLILPNEGDFFMAKKGQAYRRYSLEFKLEAARLVNEEHMSILCSESESASAPV